MKICVILAAGSARQNTCFWPSYYRVTTGIDHDLLVVHRNFIHLQQYFVSTHKQLNKVIDELEVPHQAFGAYRYAFEQVGKFYDVCVFVSDDVILKRNGWLKDTVELLVSDPIIGLVGSQIFNGPDKYPHESHARSPFLAAKTSDLLRLNWKFDSDHGGEMSFARQFLDIGRCTVQIGNKINLGFDSTEPDHITCLIEQMLHHAPEHIYAGEDYFRLNNSMYCNTLICSPWSHIGQRKLLQDIEPFNGLIFRPSLDICRRLADDIGHNTYVIRGA